MLCSYRAKSESSPTFFSPALHVLRWRFYFAVTLSLPPAQERGNNPRIAAAVQYRQHNKRRFIGCVRDQIIPQRTKTQWPRTQIGTAMSLLWERDRVSESLHGFLPVRGQRRLDCRRQ